VPCQREGWRFTGSWEEAHPGLLTQTGQRDIPYCMMSCSAYKLGEVGRRAAATAQGRAGHRLVGAK